MNKSRRTAAEARGPAKRTLDLCIAHPPDAASLEACLQALPEHLADIAPQTVTLIVIVDGPAPADLAAVLHGFTDGQRIESRLIDHAYTLGRARSLNSALDATAASGHDLLLLSHGVRFNTGSLRELLAVAAANPRAGFVAPRSTRGLFGALPEPPGSAGGLQGKASALEIVARTLPRATAVPLLDAQCLYVRHAVLVDAGGLTESFGVATHHEWEWILRATDSGWLSLLANHAAIEVVGEVPREGLDGLRNASVSALKRLHPGLAVALQWASDSGARLAEALLGGLLPDADGRLRVAVDIANVRPESELDCRRLADALGALVRQAAGRLRVTVLSDAAEFKRLGLDRIAGLGRRQIASAGSHAVALEIIGRARPLTTPGLDKLAPVLVPVFLADEPVDRLVLRGGWGDHEALRRRLQNVNGFVVPTGEDARTLRTALDLGNDPPIVMHPGSTLLADHTTTLDIGPPTHVLCVDDAASSSLIPASLAAWASTLSDLSVVVAGRGERRGKPARIIDWHGCTAAQRRQALSGAAAVVITTHRIAPMSWIGLALAAHKPLVLRNSLGNRAQLALWGDVEGVHWVADGDDIGAAVRAAVAQGSSSVAAAAGPDWDSWADTVIRFMLEQVASPDLHRRLLRRLDALPQGQAAPGAPLPAAAARSPLEQLLAQDDAGFLDGAYQLLLRREADPAGIALYQGVLERGATRADVLMSLSMSQEALSAGRRPAELDEYLGQHLGRILSLDGRRFVDQSFVSVLLRNADDMGLQHFSQQIEQGRSKLDVLLELARSDEGRARGARPSVITALVRQHEASTRHRIAAAD